ncbi:hypothetical protein [Streptomyces canus]|uniref:hypothetical protein n=1 Tax=Streptomyces canus TaxID=58343 RepID=UPI002E26CBD5
MPTRRICLASAVCVAAVLWSARQILKKRRLKSADQLAASRVTVTAADSRSMEVAPVPDEPITASLDPYTWDSETSVAYEAAVEAINGVVGAYSARIAAESSKPETERNTQALAEWRQLRTECQRARETLDAGDSQAVAMVRREYARRARELAA